MDYFSLALSAFGIGGIVGSATIAFYLKFNKGDTDHQIQLNQTNEQLINSYKERVEQVTSQLNETRDRVAALEKAREEDRVAREKKELEEKTIREELYRKNAELMQIIALRDPQVKELMTDSKNAIGIFNKEVVPKVNEIHEYTVGKTKKPDGGIRVQVDVPPQKA